MIKSKGAILLFTILSVWRAEASDVAFKGNLLDIPCQVSADSLDKHIVFKTRATRDFWSQPGRSPTESFVIKLENCHPTAFGKIVDLTFKGSEEPALPGHLQVAGVNSGRLGIALLDTDGISLLKLGVEHNKGNGDKITGSTITLPFGAYVVATPDAIRLKSVVPGDYEATATFELNYR